MISPSAEHRDFLTYGWVIGRGGLGLMSKLAFKVDASVDMRIFFASDGWFKKTECLKGKIRWVKPISQSYAMGVEFNQPIGEEQPDLLYYIESKDVHNHDLRQEGPPFNGGSA